MIKISSELVHRRCVGVSEYKSVIPTDLIYAYRVAHYSFETDADRIHFSIGQSCPALTQLFNEVYRSTALCITAYNPFGQELGDAENQAASEELRTALAELDLPFFPALGKAPDGSWGPEPGYMVFGVTCVHAKRLGSFFRQNGKVLKPRSLARKYALGESSKPQPLRVCLEQLAPVHRSEWTRLRVSERFWN